MRAWDHRLVLAEWDFACRFLGESTSELMGEPMRSQAVERPVQVGQPRAIPSVDARVGILVTSTDFSRRPLGTRGMTACGVPVHALTPDEITAALELARGLGLEPTGEVDRPHDQTVVWRRFGLRCTYLVLTLR